MFFCRGNNRLKTSEAFFNRAVDIGLAELLGGRPKNRNDLHPGFERIMKAPHIRHQRAILHTRFGRDPLGNLIRALHGRNDLGAHELSHLNSGKPGSGEPVDQLNPKVHRDQMLKAFQAVSGGQIDDFDRAGECHEFASIFFLYCLLNMLPGVVGTTYQRAGFDVTKAQTQRFFA